MPPQMITGLFLRTASVLANRKIVVIWLIRLPNFCVAIKLLMLGMAIVAIIPIRVMVIISSIRVNPCVCCRVFMAITLKWEMGHKNRQIE
ncbi:hypothetical protein A7P85_04055 [Eikenella corrodens]|uniref:Uncharacterized protein n=1 Tax=Eikenella corrodens TaxID=539 RepID=A0A1A9RFB6_EIKCO|nr:hypothetical protein A7P85_04055 [Eikenella corrodens]OAM23646.1 hypothetical protein A7P92_06105 [Eikenella corrodens]